MDILKLLFSFIFFLSSEKLEGEVCGKPLGLKSKRHHPTQYLYDLRQCLDGKKRRNEAITMPLLLVLLSYEIQIYLSSSSHHNKKCSVVCLVTSSETERTQKESKKRFQNCVLLLPPNSIMATSSTPTDLIDVFK